MNGYFTRAASGMLGSVNHPASTVNGTCLIHGDSCQAYKESLAYTLSVDYVRQGWSLTGYNDKELTIYNRYTDEIRHIQWR